jgi:hypothetical protein
MKKIPLLCLIAVLTVAAASTDSQACSCAWNGPFLSVAKKAPLVVRGRVLRHHPGAPPTMDVLVLETLAGGLLETGLAVQLGDGAMCRPSPDVFKTGSEWVLALNGPGSKPGTGLAISHCGEYWLRVENNEVAGSIDGAEKQVKRMPLREFRNRFLYPRFTEVFSGRTVSGERFRRPFGPRFEFILEPAPGGWNIRIRESGRDENLARLTPPLHSAPNPAEIEGWHLSGNPSACASRPYAAEAGPGNPRILIFSPEVGKRISGPDAVRSVTEADVEEVRRFGRAAVTIEGFKLDTGENGCPNIAWMTFSVRIEGGY